MAFMLVLHSTFVDRRNPEGNKKLNEPTSVKNITPLDVEKMASVGD